MMKDLQTVHFGQTGPLFIAGPCSAESLEQVLTTARQLAAYGIRAFRAGLWKPRTKPGSFEGVGSRGLDWLRLVKDETGMAVGTEVATRAHVLEALDAGLDFLWIGARTSANPFAVQEIADTLAERKAAIPVLVKNPVNPDIDLWIGAMERLYNAGIRKIVAVHRGFSTYNAGLYRNMPLWHIPIELSVRYPNLQIISDPSHIGGRRDLIVPLANEAINLGFQGLIIESHCNPECALSDAAQQLTPAELATILGSLSERTEAGTTETLDMLRRQIDALDSELLDVLNRRMEVSRQIGLYKRERNMPALQSSRFNSVISSRMELGQKMGMSEKFLKSVFHAIHEESLRRQL